MPAMSLCRDLDFPEGGPDSRELIKCLTWMFVLRPKGGEWVGLRSCRGKAHGKGDRRVQRPRQGENSHLRGAPEVGVAQSRGCAMMRLESRAEPGHDNDSEFYPAVDDGR